MTDVMTRPSKAVSTGEILPQRLHHTARVVKDQETTRKFYEDLIGLPLVAAWAEEAETPEHGKFFFIHTFFRLADDGALAFFQLADPDLHEYWKAEKQTGMNHMALAVSRQGQDEIHRRLEAAGHDVTLMDHGYCRSIYVEDPDGWNLEFTSDPANLPEIDAWQTKSAHATLRRWLAGDRTPNNDLHHR